MKPLFLLFAALWLSGQSTSLWAADAPGMVIVTPSTVTPAPLPAMASAQSPPASNYFPILPYGAGDDAIPQFIPVASNHTLDGDHSGITRAIVVIHDYGRDATVDLNLLTSLAADKNASTIIVAPQFLLDADIGRFTAQLPEQGKMFARWPLDGWESGGESLSQPPQKSISSFAALDLILLYLGEKKFFPSMQQIVIVGHGVGGDFTQRYAAAGQAPDILDKQNVGVRYVVANAASYLYFTNSRMVANKVNGKPSLATPDVAVCPTYNDYPYGLDKLNAYARRAGVSAMQLRYVTRPVWYLTGDGVAADDRLPDNSCAALTEGPDRMARASNYATYLNVVFGDAARKQQHWMTINHAGYDAAALYGSSCGMSALFDDGDCQSPTFRNAKNPQ